MHIQLFSKISFKAPQGRFLPTEPNRTFIRNWKSAK